MKIGKITSWEKLLSAGLLAGAITTLGLLPQAHGELVYEPGFSTGSGSSSRR